MQSRFLAMRRAGADRTKFRFHRRIASLEMAMPCLDGIFGHIYLLIFTYDLNLYILFVPNVERES